MIKNQTGYNQLNKTKKISSFYCSSQCCASGTCDIYTTKQKTLEKKQIVSSTILKRMTFDRQL